MLFLSALLFLVAWVWMIVTAFKSDQVVWGGGNDFIFPGALPVRYPALEQSDHPVYHAADINRPDVHNIAPGSGSASMSSQE